MRRICAVEGCTDRVLARGWCSRHYWRWHDHGHPLGGGTSRGEPLEWLKKNAQLADGECVVFPYARNDAGYGSILFRGTIMGAHRAMCFLAHGEPPTPDHVAAHSCGKGRDGCVHPKHLRWATSSENALDLSVHREAGIVPPAPARLSSEDCRNIAGLRGKERLKVTAVRFGISESMVCRIQRGNRREAALKRLA